MSSGGHKVEELIDTEPQYYEMNKKKTNKWELKKHLDVDKNDKWIKWINVGLG